MTQWLKLQNNFRVYLRAFNSNDFETTHPWRIDDEVTDTLVGRKHFVSKDYEKTWVHDTIFAQGNSLKLAVCLKENNAHIGNVSLDQIDFFNQNAAFSLMLGEKDFWGKGIGKEMTLSLLYHAFYEMNLKRIVSYQLEDNIASIKVHKKCGFQHEGILRKAVFKKGELVNLNLMGVLKEDFDSIIEELSKSL